MEKGPNQLEFERRLQAMPEWQELSDAERVRELADFYRSMDGIDRRYAGHLKRAERGWETVEWIPEDRTFVYRINNGSPWDQYREDIKQLRGMAMGEAIFGGGAKTMKSVGETASELYLAMAEERLESTDYYLKHAREAEHQASRMAYLASMLYADAVRRTMN